MSIFNQRRIRSERASALLRPRLEGPEERVVLSTSRVNTTLDTLRSRRMISIFGPWGGRRRPASARRRLRPGVEPMEPRQLLATVQELPVPTPNSNPFSIVAGPDGNLWFVETTGQKIGVLTPTLVPTFTVPPPASIAPDTPFSVTVTVAYGSNFLVGPPDTHFHGLVELNIDSPGYTFGNTDVGGEGSPFAEAQDGVATFSGLVLRPSFPGKSTITLEAILTGRGDSHPALAFVTVAPPVIVTQQAILNVARRRIVGFWLEFDTAMDPAAASDPANYSVVQFRRHGRRLIARRVAFRVAYIADTQRATLTLIGRPRFAAGGELVVHAAPPGGLVDAAGVPLDGGNQGVLGDDGSFAIAPKGKAISRSAGPASKKIKGA